MVHFPARGANFQKYHRKSLWRIDLRQIQRGYFDRKNVAFRYTFPLAEVWEYERRCLPFQWTFFDRLLDQLTILQNGHGKIGYTFSLLFIDSSLDQSAFDLVGRMTDFAPRVGKCVYPRNKYENPTLSVERLNILISAV